MRIYNMFHCWFLRKNFCDFFENQINEFFDFVIINENFEWKMNDILKFRYYYDRFQYRVNWSNWSYNRIWYYVDNDEFDNVRDVINDYHRNHFIVANSKSFKIIFFVFQIDDQNSFANRRCFQKKIVKNKSSESSRVRFAFHQAIRLSKFE